MTINVEYNQLDPLLRATVSSQGDVNDASTGLSPFPGNTNQLIFSMKPYVANLIKTSGIIAEFVNPKYSDDTKTTFKKPTRLECMMQDYPKILASEAKVGFTLAPAWLCYSPCKNNGQDAMVSARAGIPPSCAYSAETDQYFAVAEILRRLGALIPEAEKMSFSPFDDIMCIPGPRIVLSPSCSVFATTLKQRFPQPENVHITSRSSLIIEGDVVIERLTLDGALRLTAIPGTRLIVKCKTPIINEGTKYQQLVYEGTGEKQKQSNQEEEREKDRNTQTINQFNFLMSAPSSSFYSFSTSDPPTQTFFSKSMSGIEATSEISRMRGYILVQLEEENVSTYLPNSLDEHDFHGIHDTYSEYVDSQTHKEGLGENKIIEFFLLGGENKLIPKWAMDGDENEWTRTPHERPNGICSFFSFTC